MTSTSHYDFELERLPATYGSAMSADVDRLKAAVAGMSESSIIGIGSGGSFTVASLLCNLHETYTGRVSRPSTPLEIICNPTLASLSPVFLISAEGKNPDISEALERARRHSARTVHVLTNRITSPFMERVNNLTDVISHVFELRDKDGFLATNSQLFDSILLARAYCELDQAQACLPAEISELRIGICTLDNWLLKAESFVAQSASRGAITIVYAPLLRPIAEDLESKLSEAALLYTQLADLRSYAHGRHLWLAHRPQNCAILALIEPSLSRLWENMRALFPADVPTLTMPLAGKTPRDLISGLVAQMYLVSAIARHLNKDPGRPIVPQFGRDLYYVDLPNIIPVPRNTTDAVERSKNDVLGAHWPSVGKNGLMRRARDAFHDALMKQRFRAIVFDYDGTLCSSQRNKKPPPPAILEQLNKLISWGVVIGIASGRGDSIQECLHESLPKDVLTNIQLGLYNGGWIGNASETPINSGETSEFLSHVTRIIVRLKALGVPIETHKATHPYQVSVRFREGLSTDNMWFVIADALRQSGLDMSSMVRSKHSVDILAPGVGKSRLIDHIIQSSKIDPHDILTLGDQGAWPGNDSSLLEHRFSLSVDLPSRRLDRGWKLAPPHKRDVDATLWYMDRMVETESGSFRLLFDPNDVC